MHSTLQRLNHLTSISTTFVMVLLALISATSFLTQPPVTDGKIDVHDLIIRRGRIQRWGARDEDLAQLRFDVKVDFTPLLTSYNTKQLFLYMVADYDDSKGGQHNVVLWDRIVTRADTRDFRAVGKALPKTKKRRAGRGKVNVENEKNNYVWRNPERNFKNVAHANVTLHYSIMPYVGLVTTGVAATAEGVVEIPQRRPKA